MPVDAQNASTGHVDESEQPVEQETTKKELELLRRELRLTKEELEALGAGLDAPAEWYKIIDKVSGLVGESQRRLTVGVYTLALGSVILILTLLWKLQPLGVEISVLETPEFIIAFLVGAVLVILGASLQTYSYKEQLDYRQSAIETGDSLARDIV